MRRGGGAPQAITWALIFIVLSAISAILWGGGNFVWSQPEHPFSHRILKKLDKLEPLKRFPAIEAPAGEFLTADALADRYIEMGTKELEDANAQLLRSYIRNYSRQREPVRYVTGRFNIVAVEQITSGSIFPHGAVVLAQSEDAPNVFIEHVFPTGAQNAEAAAAFLQPGLPLVLKRGDDVTAIIRIRQQKDGRLVFTVVPLLYGGYGLADQNTGFNCDPPVSLDLERSWPVFRGADAILAKIPVAPPKPPPTVEAVASALSEDKRSRAIAVATPKPTPVSVPVRTGPELIARPEVFRPADASPSPAPVAVAANSPMPTPTPALPSPSPSPSGEVAATGPALQPFLATTRAEPATKPQSWPLYSADTVPPGRVVDVRELSRIAGSGLPDEPVFLGGEFVVTAEGSGVVVLREEGEVANPLLLNGRPVRTRVIVQYPQGTRPPPKGSRISRNARRPFEVVGVQRSPDGQVAIRVREITVP